MGRPKITVWGWGSKVKAEGVAPVSFATWAVRRIRAAWPLCTPSKKPRAITRFFCSKFLHLEKAFYCGQHALGQPAQGEKIPRRAIDPVDPVRGLQGERISVADFLFRPLAGQGQGRVPGQNRRPPAAAGQRDLPPPVPAPASPPGPGQNPPTGSGAREKSVPPQPSACPMSWQSVRTYVPLEHLTRRV